MTTMKTENFGMLDYMYTNNMLGMSSMPHRYQKALELVAGSCGRHTNRPDSDVDVVGVFVPDYEQLYPSRVPGFGTQPDRFKAMQVPDMYVMVTGVGQLKVDVQALDVVHYFNLLLKGSPNHVEMLFFEQDDMCVTPAGRLLLDNRKMFVTKALQRKLVAAGKSLMASSSKDQKKTLLAVRFFAYALHAAEHGDLRPLAPKNMIKRALSKDLAYCQRLADVFCEFAESAEQKDCGLPDEPDEEEVNRLLLTVIRAHWTYLSKGKV